MRSRIWVLHNREDPGNFVSVLSKECRPVVWKLRAPALDEARGRFGPRGNLWYPEWNRANSERLRLTDSIAESLAWCHVNLSNDRRRDIPRWKNFDLRLGFAYRVDDETAVRGGIGIFHEPALDSLVTSAPGYRPSLV
jgi:hypothetical protein